MPAAPPAPDARWQDHWPAAVLAVLAALVALWARERLFPAYSWNRDEPVYLWHVDALRNGHLTPPDGGYPRLFQPWLSARGDGVFFSQYTLGWPLVLLAAAVVTGSAGNALLLGAALAVAGTYAIAFELWHDRRIATVGAGLMVASPILAIQGGVYLSYLFTLGLGLLFGALLLSGTRIGRPLRLLAAGVLLGWIFMTRPYDAILWGLAFAAYVAFRDRAQWRAIVRPFLVCGMAALPLVLATLAYNRYATGGWLEFPITAADPLDSFGFGRKRLMPTFERIDYGVWKALRSTAKNAFVLPWFLVGSYLGLLVAVVGLWQRRREPTTLALVLVAAVFPVGYFVFWGTYLSSLASRISGPIYLVPLYAPVCLLIAAVLVGWWASRRRLALAVVVALAVTTVPVALSRFDVNRDISLRQEPWRTSAASIEGRALVFVADTSAYLLYANPFAANGPELDDRVLYAAADGPSMLDLIADMPDRTPYLQQGSVASEELGPREDPYDLQVTVQPMEVHRGPTLTLSVTMVPPEGASYASVRVQTGEADLRYTRQLTGLSGPLVEDHLLTQEAGEGALRVGDRGAVTVTVGFGETARAAATAPRLRQQLQYRVEGGATEALLPASAYRYERVGDGRQWRHAVGLAELQVALR
jgi:4-amino-4-deoxy-L-arabinose transferase-like glycosyltransferase